MKIEEIKRLESLECTACSGSGYYCGLKCEACNGTGLEHSNEYILVLKEKLIYEEQSIINQLESDKLEMAKAIVEFEERHHRAMRHYCKLELLNKAQKYIEEVEK